MSRLTVGLTCHGACGSIVASLINDISRQCRSHGSKLLPLPSAALATRPISGPFLHRPSDPFRYLYRYHVTPLTSARQRVYSG